MPPTTHLSPPSSNGQPSHRNKRRNNAKIKKTGWSKSYEQGPTKIAPSEEHVEHAAEDAVAHCPLDQRFARCSSPRSRSRKRVMELVEEVATLNCSPSRVPANVQSPDHAHEEEAAQQRAHGCPAIRQTSVRLKSDIQRDDKLPDSRVSLSTVLPRESPPLIALRKYTQSMMSIMSKKSRLPSYPPNQLLLSRKDG